MTSQGQLRTFCKWQGANTYGNVWQKVVHIRSRTWSHDLAFSNCTTFPLQSSVSKKNMKKKKKTQPGVVRCNSTRGVLQGESLPVTQHLVKTVALGKGCQTMAVRYVLYLSPSQIIQSKFLSSLFCLSRPIPSSVWCPEPPCHVFPAVLSNTRKTEIFEMAS